MEYTEEEKEKSQCKGCVYNQDLEKCMHPGSIELDENKKCLSKKTTDDDSDSEFEVQTRSETTGLEFFKTVKEAFEHAEKDKTVRKICFSIGEEDVRLIRTRLGGDWSYEPILA
jgi:predicted DNA binding CopG/RHH family protein